MGLKPGTKVENNGTKFWRVRDLRNLELLSASFQLRSLPRRILERFDISIIEQGTVRLKYRGTTFMAGPGDVIVINPGEAYSVEAADENGWTFRAFYPGADDVRDAASDALERRLPAPTFSRPVIQDSQLALLIRELHLLLETPAMGQSSLRKTARDTRCVGRLLIRPRLRSPDSLR